MKRLLKYSGYTLAGLVCLAGIFWVLIRIYEKEILAAVNEKLKEEINGDINIGHLSVTIFHDFPNVSVSLRDIYMRGPRYEEFTQDFLKAETIDINVEGLRLFNKEINIQSVTIKKGEIFIFKTRSGYTNLDILKRARKKGTSVEPPGEVSFNKINLEQVAVSFHDSLARKEFGIHFLDVKNTIMPGDSSTQFHTSGQVKFVGLMFNAAKGSFLKNKEATVDLHLEFIPRKRQLVVNPSFLKLTKTNLQLSGAFEFADPSSYQLQIQSDKVDFKEGISVLPEVLYSKLDKIDIENELDVNVIIRGLLIPNLKPDVNLTFSTENSRASLSKIKMEQMTLRGSLMNHFDSTKINDDHNVFIVLDTLYGKTSNIGFGAKATIQDFVNPVLDITANLNASLKDLNADSISDIKFKNGHFRSNFRYQGSGRGYYNKENKKYEGKLNGELLVTEGEVEVVPRKMQFEKVEAAVRFTNNEYTIENISMEMNKSPLTLQGTIIGVLPFIAPPDKQIQAMLRMSSPRMDLAKMFVKAKKVSSKNVASKNKRKISDMIDELYKQMELDLTFDVKQFVNKNFQAQDLRGRILLVNNKLQLTGVKMNLAHGQVDLSASLNQLQKKTNPFNLSAKVKNANLDELFSAFGDFNQTTIRHEHLSGKINLDVQLKAVINDDLDVLVPYIRGNVVYKVKNGRLRNFEPLQKMSLFLLKNRDVSDVQFGEITGRFMMKGTELDLSRMEVQSTVITMYLEGRYSLIDSTDLTIQVPLSNLKSRDQHIPPENIGPDQRVGASVFLRAHKGKDGTTVISYDPFKRFRKNAKKGNRK